jgi:PAS domain S-box-containing protein
MRLIEQILGTLTAKHDIDRDQEQVFNEAYGLVKANDTDRHCLPSGSNSVSLLKGFGPAGMRQQSHKSSLVRGGCSRSTVGVFPDSIPGGSRYFLFAWARLFSRGNNCDGGTLQGAINIELLLRSTRRDLTETLEALRVSEANSRAQAEQLRELSLILNTAGIGITRCSRDLHYLRANETYATIAGLPLSEIVGRPIVKVMGEAAFSTIIPYIERVLAGERLEYEAAIPFRYGTEGSYFRVVYVPDRDPSGSIIGWIACVADITTSKQAGARAADRNTQLDLAGKIAKIGTFTYDHTSQKLQLSPGCAAIYGLPESTHEISHQHWRELVHADDLPRLDAIAHEALSNRDGEIVSEFRILRDGEVRWIESRVLVTYDDTGTPVRKIGAQIDVTERKRAEHALSARNAQFELARRAGRVGDYTYDISAGTMRFTRTSMAIFDLSDSAMEITARQWHSRVHREDMQHLRDEHIRAFKERRSELVSEFRVVRPGGEIKWIEARSLISYDNAGRAKRLTGIYIDVTERRKAEDHKSLLVAELDHRVKNVLACVAAIAQCSRECSGSPEEFLDMLNRRINSLANTHALLSRSRWHGVSLGELVRSELAFCTKDVSARVEGPELVLAAEATQPIAMVLHELATNAAKYGALSNGHGRVSARWWLSSRHLSGGAVVIEWKETGGPPVTAPTANGYGTSVIRDLIPYELGGAVDYELARDGIRCTLEIPARWLSGRA